MSAAKMVADSTQSDTDSRKKRHKGAGRKEKKSKRDRKRRRHSSSSSRSHSRSRGSSPESRHTRTPSPRHSGSEEYDSDIDLQKDLKPLSDYLKNPADLLDQMLHSVRGSSLQRALPDILKTMPMEELRKRCLEHLEVLSRKRMKRILAGDDPTNISSSGTEDEESADEDKEKENGADGSKADSAAEEGKTRDTAVKTEEQSADSPLSLGAEDLDDNQPLHHHSQEAEEEEEEEGEVADIEEQEDEEEWVMGGPGMDVLFPELEQDRMDLLELEMRARAIKAMLALHEHREKTQKTQFKTIAKKK